MKGDLTEEFFQGFAKSGDVFAPGNPHINTSPVHMAFEAGRYASHAWNRHDIKSAAMSRGYSIRLKMNGGAPDEILEIDYDRKRVTKKQALMTKKNPFRPAATRGSRHPERYILEKWNGVAIKGSYTTLNEARRAAEKIAEKTRETIKLIAPLHGENYDYRDTQSVTPQGQWTKWGDIDYRKNPVRPGAIRKPPKRRKYSSHWDDHSIRHFNTWLKNTVEPKQRAAVKKMIVAEIDDNPDFLLTYSWPEIRSMAERAKKNPKRKITKKPTAKQLAARAKFVARFSNAKRAKVARKVLSKIERETIARAPDKKRNPSSKFVIRAQVASGEGYNYYYYTGRDFDTDAGKAQRFVRAGLAEAVMRAIYHKLPHKIDNITAVKL